MVAVAPAALVAVTNLTGAVTAIDEDPDAPGGDWVTATIGDNGIDALIRYAMPGGATTLTGAQDFKTYLRKTGENVRVRVMLYEWDGVGSVSLESSWRFVATLTNNLEITSATGQLDTHTWNASQLTNATRPVAMRIVGGGPTTLAFDDRVTASQASAAQIWTPLPFIYSPHANLVLVSVSWEGSPAGVDAKLEIGGVPAALVLEAFEGANIVRLYALTAANGLPAGAMSRDILWTFTAGVSAPGRLRAWSIIGAKPTGTIVAASGGNTPGTLTLALNRGCTAGSLLIAAGTMNRTTNQVDAVIDAPWENLVAAYVSSGGHWHAHADQGPIATTTTYSATLRNNGGTTGSARMALIIGEIFA